MSTRGNPFEEIERFFERMSHQFNEASRMWDSDGPLARWTPESQSMAIDMVEYDEEFVVTIDLPGYERDDVTIEVTDHTLRIEAEREERVDEESERYLRQERRHESTQRSIRLPDAVDTEAVSARMKHGVLTVTLPRIELETSREVAIDIEEE